MLSSNFDNVRKVSATQLTEDPILLKWLDLGMKSFKVIKGTSDIVHNQGESIFYKRLLQLAKDFKQFGTADINEYNMRQELFFFAGEQLNNSEEVMSAAQAMVAFVKKHFTAQAVEAKVKKDKVKKDKQKE